MSNTSLTRDMIFSERMNIVEENIREFCKYSHLMGSRIGVGYSRMVFGHVTDSSLIVKVDKRAYDPRFKNFTGKLESRNKKEVELWNSKEYSDILAPIIWHSNDYEVMFMQRAQTVREIQDLDKFERDLNELRIRVANVIGDMHIGNIGYINDKMVIIDYGETPDVLVDNIPSTIKIDVPLSNTKEFSL